MSIEECQASSEATFLDVCGFGKYNIQHRIEHQGVTYPAKAVMGRAFWHVDETVACAADLDGKGGQHAMKRLAEVGFYPPPAASPAASASTGTALGPVVTVVPCEKNTATAFATGPQPAGTGCRSEADLMGRLEEQLRGLGHHPGRLRIQPASGEGSFVTDTYDATSNVLYEVKAAANRESVRMAIGQLLDYSRYRTPLPHLAIVLPEWPGQDLADLVQSTGMALVVGSEAGFVGLPEVQKLPVPRTSRP